MTPLLNAKRTRKASTPYRQLYSTTTQQQRRHIFSTRHMDSSNKVGQAWEGGGGKSASTPSRVKSTQETPPTVKDKAMNGYLNGDVTS